MRVFLVLLFAFLLPFSLAAQPNALDRFRSPGLQKAVLAALANLFATANPDTVMAHCRFNKAGSIAVLKDHKSLMDDLDPDEDPLAYILRFDVNYGPHLVGSFWVSADSSGRLLRDDDIFDGHSRKALLLLLKGEVTVGYYDLRRIIRARHLKEPLVSFEMAKRKGNEMPVWFVTLPKLVRWHGHYYEVYYQIDAQTGTIKKISQRFRRQIPEPKE
ncbi:hypothetical protein [Flaviaesturariibacter aridisoli]|uniref:PepSY domain-containing protein n=1 Tax=Flaviaesturariibacter aridisoli TaxID=2545761 RepID=A0A4R4DVN5_9BACT|nr:hypothetical protein [Flaviaesturariibacter aridisoli]TCZ67701.1 hypothetical protein E0486_15175 [Flaviaesturariibacter aridisoli]